MTSRYAAAFTFALAAVLLSGCSGKPGNATPATQPPPTSSGTQFGAPSVSGPLDTTPLEKDPCAALNAGQVASLGAPFKSTFPQPDGATGPSCGWRFATDDGPSSVGGALATKDPGHSGISGVYGQQKMGGLTKFEPFTVDGYPGAVYDNASNPPPGFCVMAIGLREDLTYVITVNLDSLKHPFADSCAVGKKVAGYVIQYLQKGGR
ncbi:uncharacterized protein DUF3558 [Amycolatopsis sulphurea]|uniref:Uncharacterized protein DUF3558 n=1 Tax=Amycolatopsis sulphurea TaxID=76022 RepID=A0A2A9F724_9PSEU|nr:DUF3558 domain-containing protein [Amycolatopsis sulphurea]PFG47217.1 uncharacterized protein DUF3558 [Amycolatopsis sulphurea]